MQRGAGQTDHSLDELTILLQCVLSCQSRRSSGQDVVYKPEGVFCRRLADQSEARAWVAETSESVQPVLACSGETAFQKIG